MEIGCRSGPCRTCGNSGSCPAGHNDDEYVYAPPEVVEANNEEARQRREKMMAEHEEVTKKAYPDHFRDSWDEVKTKRERLAADYPEAVLDNHGRGNNKTVYTVSLQGKKVAEAVIFSVDVIVNNAAPLSKMIDDFRTALEAHQPLT